MHQCNDKSCPICVIFGSSAEESETGPTRLIVRDANLSSAFVARQKEKDPAWIPMDILEDKYENTINRITARANPRNFERVVSGVEFDFEMAFRVFDIDDGGGQDEELFKHVLDGFRLIEADTLGGAGIRSIGLRWGICKLR